MSTATLDRETKILPGMSSAEYHADHSRVSNSMLSVFRQSRQRYYRRFVSHEMPSPEPSDAMRLGTFVHTLLLEPERWADYVVAPKCDRRTNVGKAAWQDFIDSLGDKQIIEAGEHELAQRIADAVRANEVAASLMERAGDNEQTVHWTDGKTGVDCKCRPDRWCHDMLIDIKTARDSSPEGFAVKCAQLGYHRQAAWYREGVAAATGEEPPFVFVAVATTEPFDVGIYELDADALDLGAKQNLSAMQWLRTCHKNSDWREPWQKRITQLSLPKWSVYADEWEIVE